MVETHAISGRGPDGERLWIDIAHLGAVAARRTLVVLSGVHGVEGFLGSALQTDLLSRWDPETWPTDVGALVVHAVNPWGMAWGRRQNESNVDLNRNWRRDDGVPFHNGAYDELHALACPDTPNLPSTEALLAATAAMVEARGLAWVRDGITVGQYRHPDGLHYGGDRTEESNLVLEGVVARRLGEAERVLTFDLHTGHGRAAAVTALSDQPKGSPQDVFLQSICDRVETTVENPSATTALKAGQIGNGFRALLPHAVAHSTSLEFGTVDDLTQLQATYQEQWVHRRGDRTNPAHQAAIWAYRCCFTPPEPDWADSCLASGREHLDRALAAVATWT